MRLRVDQVNKAHNFFKLLLNADKDLLKEKGVEQCTKCDATGLGNIVRLKDGGYSWPDTTSFCDVCFGVGFTGIKNLKTFNDQDFYCGECQGVGCDGCDFSGFVDWITHAMGR